MKTQKVKGGARKIGRSRRKGADTSLSAYVRGKISAQKYFTDKKIGVKK